MNDRSQVKFFGREQREIRIEREAGLCAKDGVGAGAGAVVTVGARFENSAKEVQVAFHVNRVGSRICRSGSGVN